MTRSLIVAALALALAACATAEESGPSAAPFDPANCYTREFDIYFPGQTTALSRASRRIMDGMGEDVRGCHIASVRVIGATDEQGGAVSNDEISERRAQVIAEYLATRIGWPRSRMTIAAAGERGAVTEEGLAVPMRRRAHIVVEATPPQ
jgi:outer membrane protein OmpA-like peptidoglycan-associated protein